jgi:hypothetical protein
MFNIPRSLRTTQSINGYSDEGQARKDAMHKDGAKFLRQLAKELGLDKLDYSIRSNVAGIAVSGEVTLHADHLYVQMSESFHGNHLHLLYRNCKSRTDYTGGQNHYINMTELASEEAQERFLKNCRSLMERAREAAAASA